ncbi:Peptidase family M23 [Paenibacillus sp. UNCCL117]|uniref:M23 family metallopeptidase n=1 Tax=unclassified Paenibacillus TaxID=185978 RepID=UPI00088B8FD8|nr:MULTISPECIES: M23 family metallopeptidase [unclassified Paenibacillus]SDD65605.1 Peptidase family M23 [Paenibacillus sp. cl123]SFW58090.1 Peptidase family M23 [Paenibacillus sp. UNCCL117]
MSGQREGESLGADMPQKGRTGRARKRKKARPALLLTVLCAVIGGAGLGIYLALAGGGTPSDNGGLTGAAANRQPEPPCCREAVEFRMTDLDNGWIRYTDGFKTTADGGMTWTETDRLPEAQAGGLPAAGNAPAAGGAASPETVAAPQLPAGYEWLRLKDEAAQPPAATLRYQGADYPIKQLQRMTDRIGWALVQDSGELAGKLMVTADGGVTWQAEAGEAVRTAIREEKELLAKRQEEAALYASAEQAKQAFRSEWLLLPDTASPGDAVLVRHSRAGDIEWQGKTYTLQPYGSGYFTYLPIGMGVKPGSYPIGDQSLKIVAKRFETQYLKVTEEMESMRQDTQRINADQQKIDAARSKSQPEFLFREPFVVPVEGRLTTPYGYTRYVNGKLSGSHMAIDLAAKEGTPIRATNDGIVALADSLYLTGNSIYLDHGMGLFSQYAHLSKLNVKTGDRVKRGDIIGLVGTTGFSTGPHLHFTFWVHNVQANPNQFMDSSPFQWGRKTP